MDKSKRVVITGIGVVAPNGTRKEEFSDALFNQRSGIKFLQDQKDLNFGSCIGGKPNLTEEILEERLTPLQRKMLDNDGVIYGLLAGMEAWEDAGLPFNKEIPDLESGMIFGSGALSMGEFIRPKVEHIHGGNVRLLGSKTIVQAMSSGTAAFLSGVIGLGNRIMSNSSACSTGTEALVLSYEHIQQGRAKRMICGSSEASGKYIWGAFDAMRVLCRDSNDDPEFGSRPMSSTSSGFVPGAGGGALVIETLEEAKKRGAKIYAEILGGEINSGGQRNGGTMTIPNSDAVQQCIKNAIAYSNISPSDIDLISGHLTSTIADPIEINNWVEALGVDKENMPYFNATKSLIGHCIAAAGSIELVGCVLQMMGNFIHGSLNSDELHPDIAALVPREKIPVKTIQKNVHIVAKANFGFGDVNSCVILKKWDT